MADSWHHSGVMIVKTSSERSTNLFIDLLMLVVGINVALWFEGYFEDRRDAETAQHYLVDLREDLLTDVKRLEKVIEINQARVEGLSELLPTLSTLADASAEEQAKAMHAPSSYTFFQPSDATYRSMMESGDFRLLTDASIKRKILNLNRHWQEIDILQNNFLQAMDDEYIPLMMRGYDIIESRIKDPEIVNNLIFKNFFVFSINDIGGRLHAYKRTLELSNELLDILPTAAD